MAYRSNTLGVAQLKEVIDTNKIKTIINLRGGSTAERWYRDEARVSGAMGVTMIDIPMSDSSEPDTATLKALIAALEKRRPSCSHSLQGRRRPHRLGLRAL